MNFITIIIIVEIDMIIAGEIIDNTTNLFKF